jgi:hypothetical protein
VPLSPRTSTASLLATLIACAAGLTTTRAAADDAACISASEQALSLRQGGKLRDSLKQLAVCADPSCPAEVRAECERRVDEVKAAQPTLVLAAKDGAGNDLYAVKVSVDGVPLASSLDGRPVVLDPGEHTFTLEAAGQPPVEKKLVLREGDKERHESVLIGPPAPPGVLPPPSTASTWTTRKTLAVVSAGLGVVGVALGSGWGAYAISSQNREKSDCSKTACANPRQATADYNTATQDATASTVALVVGGVLVATGAVLWLTAPKADETSVSTSHALRVVPMLSASAGGLILAGGF